MTGQQLVGDARLDAQAGVEDRPTAEADAALIEQTKAEEHEL